MSMEQPLLMPVGITSLFCASLGLSPLIKVLLTSCLTPQPLYSCLFLHHVFDLTALDSVGFFAIEHYQAPTDTLPLRMGFLEQDTSRREYYLLGSRPNRGINIISYVDIAGKTLPVTTNFELVRSGQAVSVGYSYQSNPYTPYNPYYISTYVGQITCSSYGDVYFIESSMLGSDGENTSFRYTGPIHRAPSSNR